MDALPTSGVWQSYRRMQFTYVLITGNGIDLSGTRFASQIFVLTGMLL